MALNKKDEFPEIDNKVADFAKALSHPARISILRKLSEDCKCMCGEIVEVMPISQSTVSQHLKELKSSGIITRETEGVKSCYCIDWDKLEKELLSLNNLVKDLETKFETSGCCV